MLTKSSDLYRFLSSLCYGLARKYSPSPTHVLKAGSQLVDSIIEGWLNHENYKLIVDKSIHRVMAVKQGVAKELGHRRRTFEGNVLSLEPAVGGLN